MILIGEASTPEPFLHRRAVGRGCRSLVKHLPDMQKFSVSVPKNLVRGENPALETPRTTVALSRQNWLWWTKALIQSKADSGVCVFKTVRRERVFVRNIASTGLWKHNYGCGMRTMLYWGLYFIEVVRNVLHPWAYFSELCYCAIYFIHLTFVDEICLVLSTGVPQ